MTLIDEAVLAGARLDCACAELGLSVRTVERWRAGKMDDERHGPKTEPANALSDAERRHAMQIVNSPEFRSLSPAQIVPRLADQGVYVASESTIRRLLREAKQNVRRERSRNPTPRTRATHVASGPNQVWSWDITYLRSPVRGLFYYLYLVEDIFSRKIVAWAVHEQELSGLAAELMEKACLDEGIAPYQLVLHADNGKPMKGSTMRATLERLGVAASYSRPSVSDDNAFAESLFRTLKYRPEYPSGPFASLEAARGWVAEFVYWYNHVHLHSSIRYVTPAQRHDGIDAGLLAGRSLVYAKARAKHPERWSRDVRNWTPVGPVTLNPSDVIPMPPACPDDSNSAAA
jgi:putative transposase